MGMGVDVVVIREDGQILLTKRADFPVWCIPGGGVEDGESVGQTAVREVFEETGFHVALERLVGIYSRPKWLKGEHVVVFAARPIGGTPTPQETEVVEMGYFAPNQLPRELAWWQRFYITDALRGIGGSAAKTIDVTWPFGEWLTRDQILEMQKNPENWAKSVALLYEMPDYDVQHSEINPGQAANT
jgi:8-oxo-dGTP diphosphatase